MIGKLARSEAEVNGAAVCCCFFLLGDISHNFLRLGDAGIRNKDDDDDLFPFLFGDAGGINVEDFVPLFGDGGGSRDEQDFPLPGDDGDMSGI